MRHETDGRYRVARYHELNVSVKVHTGPDFDDAIGTTCDKFNLLSVFADRHFRLYSVVFLVRTLVHRVLRLDNDHASDYFAVRILGIMW